MADSLSRPFAVSGGMPLAPGPGPVSAAVVDRLLGEGLIPLADVAKLIPSPKRGRKLAANSVLRWALVGKRGVRLEACPGAGRGLYTSRPAVARFLAAIGGRA